jgi:hypothetical protein
LPAIGKLGNGAVEGDASSWTMFRRPAPSAGFAAPIPTVSRAGAALPALIASVSLVLSIAVVLTAVTMSAARAAHLF